MPVAGAYTTNKAELFKGGSVQFIAHSFSNPLVLYLSKKYKFLTVEALRIL